MRQGQQHRRGRTRGGQGGGGNNHGNSANANNHNRKGQNPISRSYQSNGPDGKVSGTAAGIAEKYLSMARDATTSGDPVLAENYLQHAEHYNRIILAYRETQMQNDPNRGANQSEAEGDDGAEDDGETYGRDMQPLPPMESPQPRIMEHQPRGGEQPQPRNDQQRFEQRPDQGRDSPRGDDRQPRFNDQQRRNQPRERYQPERFNNGGPDRNFNRNGGPDRPPAGERNGTERPERSGNDRPERSFADRPDRAGHERQNDRAAHDRNGNERGPNDRQNDRNGSERAGGFDRFAAQRGGDRFQDRPHDRGGSERPAFLDRQREQAPDTPERSFSPATVQPQPVIQPRHETREALRTDSPRLDLQRPEPRPERKAESAPIVDAATPQPHHPVESASTGPRLEPRFVETAVAAITAPTTDIVPASLRPAPRTVPDEPVPRPEPTPRAPRAPRRPAATGLEEHEQPEFLRRAVRRPRREVPATDEAPPAAPTLSEPEPQQD